MIVKMFKSHKKKRSKLAVASLIIPIIITVWDFLYYSYSPVQKGFWYIFQEYFIIIVWLSWLVGLILGIVALRRVKKSKGVLKGFGYALTAVIMCSCFIFAQLLFIVWFAYSIHVLVENMFPFNLFPTS
ncbi:hypothetical protein ACFL1G_10850 [Planctomycetota bacterium]